MTEDIWYAINSAYVDINSDLSGGVMLPLVRSLFGLSAVAASGAKLTMSLSTFVVFYVWLIRNEKRAFARMQPPSVTEA